MNKTYRETQKFEWIKATIIDFQLGLWDFISEQIFKEYLWIEWYVRQTVHNCEVMIINIFRYKNSLLST